MSFDWYTEVPHTEKLTQGDTFFQLPVLVIEESEKYPFFKPKWTKKDVIVITQACDIEQGKVNEITFCPISPVETVVAELMKQDAVLARNNQWKSGKVNEEPIVLDFSTEPMMKKARKKIDEIRKGVYLPLHLLNETSLKAGNIEMGAKVVLLRDTYQLPLVTASKLLFDPSTYPTRLRLLPPYREHLGQAFANVYSRIGLPRDVKSTEVRLNFPSKIEFPYDPPKEEEVKE